MPEALRPGTRPRHRRPGGRRRRWPAALAVLAVALAVLFLMRSERPPRRPDDLCAIFRQKLHWYRSTQDSFATWGVPEAVQMALIHQESGFRAQARPRHGRFLWIFPGRRRSSAHGYAQAIDATWQEFRDRSGRPDARRYRFDDAAHFVGWYGDELHRLTGVAKDDAYNLYLAYHEGPGGYRRGSHREKEWLLDVGLRVAERAATYQRQYESCAGRLRWLERWRLAWRGALLLAAVILWWYVWPWGRRRRRPSR